MYQRLNQEDDIANELLAMLPMPSDDEHLAEKSSDLYNQKIKRRARKAARSEIPPNVSASDWKSMEKIATSHMEAPLRRRTVSKSHGSLLRSPATNSFNRRSFNERTGSRTPSIRSQGSICKDVANKFQRRECVVCVPSLRNIERCGCGRMVISHDLSTVQLAESPSAVWSLERNCSVLPTNAFGTIEFEGGPHPLKSQYLRLDFDSDPADIINHMQEMWKITQPRLVITIHGGMTNFPLQPKLIRTFQKGLVKAAGIPGAWIVTSGIESCVVNYVTDALYGSSFKFRNKPVTIGIAPWGALRQRNVLVGMDKVVSYYRGTRRSDDGLVELNRRHSFFLLVDNGTVGRYGADVFLRRRLESYIAEKQTLDIGSRRVPVVCVVLEGGRSTVRSVLNYVTKIPRIPVVICDGSGRASDLISFAHRRCSEDGEIRDRKQLSDMIMEFFGCDAKKAKTLNNELEKIIEGKDLITIFGLGDTPRQELDHAILTALLKGQNLKLAEKLTLALAWDRADVARSDIFVGGQEWPKRALYSAMLDALIHNRVDFVRLLLENGVSMKEFLTIARLENLYNSTSGPKNTLSYIVDDVAKAPYDRYTLPYIGLAVEKLIGNGFRSSYTSPSFRIRYETYRKNVLVHQPKGNAEMMSAVSTAQGPLDQMAPPITGNRALSNHLMWRSVNRGFTNRPDVLTDSVVIDMDETTGTAENGEPHENDFQYPFSDLMIWAVLTGRKDMAYCMWEHGEDALAKSLISSRLLKSLAKEASEDYLDLDICEDLKNNAEEFRELSVQLLDHCYRKDDMATLELLTYELHNWGRETCLTLAVTVNNKQFVAHPCAQALLADLWIGGMRIRSNINLKVIGGLLFLPFLLFIDFKSPEELKKQPQTAAEHADDSSDSDAGNTVGSISRSSSSSSSSSDDSDLSANDEGQNASPRERRRISTSSLHSAPFSIFRSRRRHRGASETADRKSLPDNHVPQSPIQMVNLERSNGASDRKAQSESFSGEEGNYRAQFITADHKQSKPKQIKAKNLISKKWSLNKRDKIRFQRRIYEFYAAPITTFWSWTLTFAAFLGIFTYTLLIKTPPEPSWLEWFLLAYVVGFLMEIIRKLCMSDPKTFREKLEFFFLNYWNALTAAAILMFIIGFIFRCHPSAISTGRVILATNSMLWCVKLLDFLSVYPHLGPYIKMAGKMITNMSSIVVMLLISLLAFGLARQSITYPNEEWNWILLRNVFYKPYFMLYGEVYADEIDTCGDQWWDEHLEKQVPVDDLPRESASCVPGYWIPPVLMTFFLLVANIILISLLIAIFNNIFDGANKVSHQMWLFQRYRQVMEYQNMSTLPPPLTPIYHFYLFYKFLKFKYKLRQEQMQDAASTGEETDPRKQQRAERKRKQKARLLREQLFDTTPKLFFNQQQINRIQDFEEECMESLAQEKEYQSSCTNDERLYRTCEQTDVILQRINDLTSRDSAVKNTVRVLQANMETLASRQFRADIGSNNAPQNEILTLSEIIPEIEDLEGELQHLEEEERCILKLRLKRRNLRKTNALIEIECPIGEFSSIAAAKIDEYILNSSCSLTCYRVILNTLNNFYKDPERTEAFIQTFFLDHFERAVQQADCDSKAAANFALRIREIFCLLRFHLLKTKPVRLEQLNILPHFRYIYFNGGVSHLRYFLDEVLCDEFLLVCPYYIAYIYEELGLNAPDDVIRYLPSEDTMDDADLFEKNGLGSKITELVSDLPLVPPMECLIVAPTEEEKILHHSSPKKMRIKSHVPETPDEKNLLEEPDNDNVDSANGTCWIKPQFTNAVVIIVDALRYDFISPIFSKNDFYRGQMPSIGRLLLEEEQNCRLYKFIADAPTTTMQRLSALVTGSIPAFIEARDNFAAAEIAEDNLIRQFAYLNRSTAFFGDDTWIKLLPDLFEKTMAMDSFDVKDLDSVDYAITSKLLDEIEIGRSSLVVAHFLGVDHCGHRYGPNHPEMKRKLNEIDSTLNEIISRLGNDTILFVLGDHGMTETGDHGGDSQLEVTAAMFVYSKRPLPAASKLSEIKQVDFVPTLALLMDVPIPYSSVGTIVGDLFGEQVRLKAEELNVMQMLRYVDNYTLFGAEFHKSALRLLRIHDQKTLMEPNLSGIEIVSQLRELIIKSVTNFNVEFIQIGLLSLTDCLFQNVALLLDIQLSTLSVFLIHRSGLHLLQYAVAFGSDSRTPNMAILNLTLSAFVIYSLAMILWHLSAKRWNSFGDGVYVAFIILLATSAFSNSFVIYGPTVLRFLLNSFMVIDLLQYFLMFRTKKRISWKLDTTYIVGVMVICRVGSLFERCREEQIGCSDYSLWRPMSHDYYMFIQLLVSILFNMTAFYLHFEYPGWPNGEAMASQRIFTSTGRLSLVIVYFHWICEGFASKEYSYASLLSAQIVYGISILSVILAFCGSIRVLVQSISMAGFICVSLILDSQLSISASLSLLMINLWNKRKRRPLANVVFHCILAQHLFYALGHNTTLTSIPWSAAFVGIPGNITNKMLPAALVLLHLYCGVIFALFNLSLSESPLWLMRSVMAISASCVLLTCAAGSLHKRHLMFFKIFAPNVIFNVLGFAFVAVISFATEFGAIIYATFSYVPRKRTNKYG